MSSSNAVTSSAALTELQSNLTQLSSTLHEVYEMMNTDMSHVGHAWQDGKYQEFVDGYKPQIQKCEVISEQYKLWCTKVLAPTIENVMAVERTDVGNGGGSVGGPGVASAGIMAGATGVAGTGAVGGNVGGFNLDGKQSSNQEDNSVPHYNRWQRNAHIGGKTLSGLSDADYACQKSYGGIGGTMHAVPVEIVKSHKGSGFTTHMKDPGNEFKVGAKATAGVKAGVGPMSLEAGAGPEVSYTVKGIETEAEIGCMSEKKMEELSQKEGISFNM